MNLDTVMNWSELDGHILINNIGNLFWAMLDLTKLSDDDKNYKPYIGFVDIDSSPEIFNRVLLDMLNVMGVPYYPVDSLLPNGNPSFIIDRMPNEKLRLSYASASGGAGENIKSVYEKKIQPAYDEQGLPFHSAKATFVAVVTSDKRQSIMQEVEEAFPVGMSEGDAIKLVVGDKDNLPPKQNHYWSVGFAMDPDIGERVRLSVLSIHPTEE